MEEGKHMQSTINVLLNTVLVSIPEEMFLTIMTLIILKRFDMLDIRMWRQNLKSIMIPVLIVATLMNALTCIPAIPSSIGSIFVLIIFYLLLVYIIKKNSYDFVNKDYWKILLSLSCSFFILGLLESITIPLILFLLHKPLSFINDSSLWNFLASLPSRILEFLTITFLIIKHNNVVKIRMFEIITKNNFLLGSITSFAILSNIFAVYSIKLIGFDRILENKVPMLGQVLVSMAVLVVPAIIIFWALLLINYLSVREKMMMQTYESFSEQDNEML